MNQQDPFSLYLFSIGFRCEGVREELQKYKEDKAYQPPIRAIEDCIDIVEDCILSQGRITHLYELNKAPVADLFPFLHEIYPNTTIECMVRNLTNTKTDLEKIKQGEKNIECSVAMDLFKNISELCLRENSRQQSVLF